jgi:hypothetical protein
MGPADLHHRLLGLDGGQVVEVAEHLLDLGQVVGGVGCEAGLEVGGLGKLYFETSWTKIE